jgi:hypothetical protein
MLSAVLGLAGSAGLYKLVGGGATLVAAVYFLISAARLTVTDRGPARLYRLLVIWFPGLLAACLAAAGLALTVSSAPASLAYCLGALLFAAELAMLTVAGADLSEMVDSPLSLARAV